MLCPPSPLQHDGGGRKDVRPQSQARPLPISCTLSKGSQLPAAAVGTRCQEERPPWYWWHSPLASKRRASERGCSTPGPRGHAGREGGQKTLHPPSRFLSGALLRCRHPWARRPAQPRQPPRVARKRKAALSAGPGRGGASLGRSPVPGPRSAPYGGSSSSCRCR